MGIITGGAGLGGVLFPIVLENLVNVFGMSRSFGIRGWLMGRVPKRNVGDHWDQCGIVDSVMVMDPSEIAPQEAASYLRCAQAVARKEIHFPHLG